MSSIIDFTRRLEKDPKLFKQYRLHKRLNPAKTKISPSKSYVSKQDVIREVARVYHQYKELANRKKELKSTLGTTAEQFKVIDKSIRGQGLKTEDVKKMEKEFGMSIGHFPEIKRSLAGAEFKAKDLSAVRKRVARLQRLNVLYSSRERDKMSGGLVGNLTNRREGKNALRGVTTRSDEGGEVRVGHEEIGVAGRKYGVSVHAAGGGEGKRYATSAIDPGEAAPLVTGGGEVGGGGSGAVPIGGGHGVPNVTGAGVSRAAGLAGPGPDLVPLTSRAAAASVKPDSRLGPGFVPTSGAQGKSSQPAGLNKYTGRNRPIGGQLPGQKGLGPPARGG